MIDYDCGIEIFNLSSLMDTCEGKWKVGRLETYPTNETVRVPLAIQCRNVVVHDRAIARATFWGEHVEIVFAAVWFALPFMKTVFSKLLPALSAKEVLHVPGLLQSCNTFLKKDTLIVNLQI